MMTEGDVKAASALGADYVGFVIDFPRSPRSLTVGEASELASRSRVPVVSVVVDPQVSQLQELVKHIRPHAIQFAGGESAAFIESSALTLPGVEMWKTIHLSGPSRTDPMELQRKMHDYAAVGVSKILFDSATAMMPGGTGLAVDWTLATQVAKDSSITVVLSGGLKPENVRDAIHTTGIHAVDVSSGIEDNPGTKNHDRMSHFVLEARRGFADIESYDA